jgi:hypothetical protein
MSDYRFVISDKVKATCDETGHVYQAGKGTPYFVTCEGFCRCMMPRFDRPIGNGKGVARARPGQVGQWQLSQVQEGGHAGQEPARLHGVVREPHRREVLLSGLPLHVVHAGQERSARLVRHPVQCAGLQDRPRQAQMLGRPPRQMLAPSRAGRARRPRRGRLVSEAKRLWRPAPAASPHARARVAMLSRSVSLLRA